MRILAGLALAFSLAGAAFAQPVNTGHLTAELVPETQGIAPGQTIHVALRQKIQKDWHTYWRNAGDAGEPTAVKWTLPAGWSAGDIIWPAPHRLPVGPLMNYGYEDEVLLPMTLTAPADARPGQTINFTVAARFLVCADVCVPEDAVLKLDLPVTGAPGVADPQWGAKIAKAVADAPKPANLTARFEKQGANLKLAIAGAALKGADLADAYFFPFSGTVIDHAKPQQIERGPDGLTLTLTPGYDFQGGGQPQSMAGLISVGNRAYEIAATPGPPPAGTSGLGAPVAKGATAGSGFTIPLAAFYALIGGLILNLMPCVFPILAMKAASLARHAHARSEARMQGLAFGAGSILTFLLLAGALIGLKTAGSAVGWGFQLQSPPVVAALSLLMLLVALNLSGLFEIGTSLQGVGSGLASKGGLTGAFFTGALAVIVAAPCTAPFMGPAIGWALTQPAAGALAVFFALGLGFALPFVLVAYIPGILARLPKPGPWMEAFKKALAFPMYGAAAWLIWVVAQQADAAFLARVLAAAVVVAAAAWIVGLAQRKMSFGEKPIALASVGTVLGAVALALAVWPQGKPALEGEPYSAERLASLQSEGRVVFVNYTAAWCVSCQVNDKTAISTGGAVKAFRKHNAVYLKADWTKRDPIIAADLTRFGRAGVPLYLVYGPKKPEPDILPALLTEGIVVKALDDAAPS